MTSWAVRRKSTIDNVGRISNPSHVDGRIGNPSYGLIIFCRLPYRPVTSSTSYTLGQFLPVTNSRSPASS